MSYHAGTNKRGDEEDLLGHHLYRRTGERGSHARRGGAASYVGAVASALASMVGNLTVGRKKYAQYEADVKRMLEKGAAVQERLLDLVDKDAEAFEPLSKAYSIPKDDPKHDETLEAATSSPVRRLLR
mgnify:CR=1 FL=1